ncbi:hypothetical protein BDZ89DRAFT_1035613 [Hymenopellis radicata]|nr:hypothetical protein BDZ89DRAFT_1035613 [Hymenopellis radicata]
MSSKSRMAPSPEVIVSSALAGHQSASGEGSGLKLCWDGHPRGGRRWQNGAGSSVRKETFENEHIPWQRQSLGVPTRRQPASSRHQPSSHECCCSDLEAYAASSELVGTGSPQSSSERILGCWKPVTMIRGPKKRKK